MTEGVGGTSRWNQASLPQWARRFAKVTGVIVFLGGMAVLLGWAMDIGTLKSTLPGRVSMAPITALCFAAAGLGLWCAAAVQDGHLKSGISWISWISRGLAVAVILAAWLKLG